MIRFMPTNRIRGNCVHLSILNFLAFWLLYVIDDYPQLELNHAYYDGIWSFSNVYPFRTSGINALLRHMLLFRINIIFCKTELVNSCFIPYVENGRNLLQQFSKLPHIQHFRSHFLTFISQRAKSTFRINDTSNYKILACLDLDFNHLREYK